MKSLTITENGSSYTFTLRGLEPGGEVFGAIFYDAKSGHDKKIDVNVIDGDKQTTQVGFEVGSDGTWKWKKSKSSLTGGNLPGKITAALATTNNEFVQDTKEVS